MKNFIDTIKGIISRQTEFLAPTRAKVISVDESTLEVTVIDTADETAEYDAVLRATSIQGVEAGVIPIPKIGSLVMIEFVDQSPSQAFVSKFSEISKYKIVSETSIAFESQGHSITIDSEGIRYLDTAGEPMVMGQALMTYLAKLDATMQAIILWGAKGVAPGATGGIVPLAGVTHTAVNDSILSQKGKIS